MATEKSENKNLNLSVGSRPKKYFSKYRESILELPNLFEGQLNSFDWLKEFGIKEVFEEYSGRYPFCAHFLRYF